MNPSTNFAVEFWAIYAIDSGTIIQAGHGPTGISKLQTLNQGQAIILQRANPSTDCVTIKDGKPVVTPKA